MVGGMGVALGVIDRVARHIASSSAPMAGRLVEVEASRLLRMEAPHSDFDSSVVVDHLTGLGPIGALLRRDDVTDVLVNGPNEVWVESRGELGKADVRFEDAEAVLTAIERVIAPLGLRIDRSSPFVDARLPDGSRLHAVIPPAAADHPLMAIRRFSQRVPTLESLVEIGSATVAQIRDLGERIEARESILISGGTGSGKTTLLNLAAALIPRGERIVTIEDAAELDIAGHVVRLEARPPNSEGAGEVTIRMLLRSALRLRPDRIVVGEVRGAEALDLVSALNTGHRGSLSTIHANSPEEAMWRLETLAMAAGDVPETALNRQIYAAIGSVVQLERQGPHRRIVEIASVRG